MRSSSMSRSSSYHTAGTVYIATLPYLTTWAYNIRATEGQNYDLYLLYTLIVCMH